MVSHFALKFEFSRGEKFAVQLVHNSNFPASRLLSRSPMRGSSDRKREPRIGGHSLPLSGNAPECTLFRAEVGPMETRFLREMRACAPYRDLVRVRAAFSKRT